ncbi:MAG: arginine deiminase, partial [Alphaproteobacteria bacterium]|nr:arginine deiminase [Alphaproteobacteria bacterium]
MSEPKLGVHSEAGTLRQVIVSPPGLAHRRLTPDNREDLLFDDVFWVKQAIKDHAVFADVMRGEGVEVLDAMALLGETLDISDARAWVLDHRITRNDVGVGMRDDLRAWMEGLPGTELARLLVGGIRVDDLPFTPSGMFGSYLGPHGFVLPPLPNFIFTRDNSAWVYGGVSLNPMHFAARRPETLLIAAVYRFHPTFAGRVRVLFGDPTREYGAATLEGGDIMPIGHGVVMVGMGERSTPQAVGQLAEALFEGGDVTRVIASQMPRSRAAMHLDTVFTHCGGDVVTTFKEVADAITCYDLRPGQGKAALDNRRDARHLFEITAEILGHKKLHLVPTGGSDAAEQSREQWNDGNNVLALRPGVVIGYDRNDDTNAALK